MNRRIVISLLLTISILFSSYVPMQTAYASGPSSNGTCMYTGGVIPVYCNYYWRIVGKTKLPGLKYSNKVECGQWVNNHKRTGWYECSVADMSGTTTTVTAEVSGDPWVSTEAFQAAVQYSVTQSTTFTSGGHVDFGPYMQVEIYAQAVFHNRYQVKQQRFTCEHRGAGRAVPRVTVCQAQQVFAYAYTEEPIPSRTIWSDDCQLLPSLKEC